MAALAAATYLTTQAATGAVSSGGALFASLDGTSEIGTDGKKGAGDPDGWGGAVVTVKGDQVCFGLTVNSIGSPVAAHIHEAKSSVNGPVVIPLTPPASGDSGASSACVTVDPAIAAALLAHPQDFYVNVHTADIPSGAIRGQLKG
jgi:hypothetical protein